MPVSACNLAMVYNVCWAADLPTFQHEVRHGRVLALLDVCCSASSTPAATPPFFLVSAHGDGTAASGCAECGTSTKSLLLHLPFMCDQGPNVFWVR